MANIRGVRLRKFKLRKIILGVRMHFRHTRSRHKDTDQCLIVAISFYRHRSVPVPCENGSAETTAAEGGRNLVAGLWGHTLSEN